MRAVALLAIGVLALAAAACGGDSAGEPTVVPSTPTAAATAQPPSPTPTEPPPATATTSPSPTASATPAPTAPSFVGTIKDTFLTPDLTAEPAILVAVRIGRNEGFDRFVLEFAGDGVPGGTVRYAEEAITCGAGETTELAGAAVLTVELLPAAAHDLEGMATVADQELAGIGDTILEARSICDFEGVVAWALGVVAEREFRVFRLTEPARLVVDVKQ